MSGSGVSIPWWRKNSTAMGPERSSYSPAAARVDATMTKSVRVMGSPYLKVLGLQAVYLHGASSFYLGVGRNQDSMCSLSSLGNGLRCWTANNMLEESDMRPLFHPP